MNQTYDAAQNSLKDAYEIGQRLLEEANVSARQLVETANAQAEATRKQSHVAITRLTSAIAQLDTAREAVVTALEALKYWSDREAL